MGAARMVWSGIAGFRTFHSLVLALNRDVNHGWHLWESSDQSVVMVSSTQSRSGVPCDWIPEKDYGEAKKEEDHR